MIFIEKLKVISLFSGIGAFEGGLERLGIDFELAGISEIEVYPLVAYAAIHCGLLDYEHLFNSEEDIDNKREHIRHLGLIKNNKPLYVDKLNVRELNSIYYSCILTKNLGDISEVESLLDYKDKVDLIVGGSPCFVAGTKILTSDGYKNIEDLIIGDEVLTHKNRFKPVIAVGGQSSETVTLKMQGVLPTETTMNHPYYIRSKNTITGKLSNPEWKEVGKLKKGDYIGINIPNTEENPLNLTGEECWLLGRYLADGHYRNDKRVGRKDSRHYQVIFSIGDEKVDEFKKEVRDYHFSCYKHTSSVFRCVISSMRLVNLIKDLKLGKGAINKQIPNEILNLPVQLANRFLDGYMSGDGCLIENKFSATTISEELALGLTLLVAKCKKKDCGIYYNKTEDTTVIEGRTVNQSDTYIVRFFKERRRNGSAVIIDDKIWLPFKERIEHNTKTQVYNISVQDDETYTANNAIVHNCQDFSIAGKQQGSIFKCLDCESEFNPLIVHHTKRDYCSKCNSTNLEKTRSSLLIEYLRTIREVRPKYFVYENVKNIVGKKFKKAFDMFNDELQEYGYNTYYQVLNAKDYGIPQNRERIFVIGIREDIDKGEFEFPKPFDSGLRLKDLLQDEVEEKYYINNDRVDKLLTELKGKLPHQETSYCIDANYAKGTNVDGFINKKRRQLVQEDVKICAERGRYNEDGKIEQQLEVQESGNSNALTTVQKDNLVLEPSILRYERTEYGKEIRRQYEKGEIEEKIGNMRELKPRNDGVSNTLTTVQKDNLLLEPNELKFVGGIGEKDWVGDDKEYSRNYPQGNRVYDASGIACSQTAQGGGIGSVTGLYLEEKTPNELQLFTNLSGGKWDKIHESARRVYKESGISPTIPTCGGGNIEPKVAVREATKKGYAIATVGDSINIAFPNSTTRRGRVGEGVAQTLETGCNQATLESDYKIRKLTPLECWRLMNFNDEDYWKARKALEATYYNGGDRSNSQMYKMAGNSICINVLVEIYKKMFKEYINE